MAIRITKSNQSGFSSVPGDETNEVEDLNNYLPTVLEETTFSIDLTFDGKYSDGVSGFTYLPATNNTSSF